MNPINYLTIDVEDYFHVHAFSNFIKPDQWDTFECRVEKNVHHILDLLDGVNGDGSEVRTLKICDSLESTMGGKRRAIKATFFILGWIAERYPRLVKEIHSRGHEIASHGYSHKVIYHQTQEEFREDIRKSKQILEDLTGEAVIGYRAPTYSITNKTLWALQILLEEGYKYDSSIFPIRHDYYGMPQCPRFPFLWNLDAPTPSIVDRPSSFLAPQHSSSLASHPPSGQAFSPPSLPASQPPSFLASWPSSYLFEFPLSTLNLFGQRIPVAGGGYFRLFPYWFTRWALARVNSVEKQAFIFYLHPWEIDPDQPRLSHVGVLSRFRHYNNLHKTKYRFTRLLQDFSFTSILNGNPYLQN